MVYEGSNRYICVVCRGNLPRFSFLVVQYSNNSASVLLYWSHFHCSSMKLKELSFLHLCSQVRHMTMFSGPMTNIDISSINKRGKYILKVIPDANHVPSANFDLSLYKHRFCHFHCHLTTRGCHPHSSAESLYQETPKKFVNNKHYCFK